MVAEQDELLPNHKNIQSPKVIFEIHTTPTKGCLQAPGGTGGSGEKSHSVHFASPIADVKEYTLSQCTDDTLELSEGMLDMDFNDEDQRFLDKYESTISHEGICLKWKDELELPEVIDKKNLESDDKCIQEWQKSSINVSADTLIQDDIDVNESRDSSVTDSPTLDDFESNKSDAIDEDAEKDSKSCDNQTSLCESTSIKITVTDENNRCIEIDRVVIVDQKLNKQNLDHSFELDSLMDTCLHPEDNFVVCDLKVEKRISSYTPYGGVTGNDLKVSDSATSLSSLESMPKEMNKADDGEDGYQCSCDSDGSLPDTDAVNGSHPATVDEFTLASVKSVLGEIVSHITEKCGPSNPDCGTDDMKPMLDHPLPDLDSFAVVNCLTDINEVAPGTHTQNTDGGKKPFKECPMMNTTVVCETSGQSGVEIGRHDITPAGTGNTDEFTDVRDAAGNINGTFPGAYGDVVTCSERHIAGVCTEKANGSSGDDKLIVASTHCLKDENSPLTIEKQTEYRICDQNEDEPYEETDSDSKFALLDKLDLIHTDRDGSISSTKNREASVERSQCIESCQPGLSDIEEKGSLLDFDAKGTTDTRQTVPDTHECQGFSVETSSSQNNILSESPADDSQKWASKEDVLDPSRMIYGCGQRTINNQISLHMYADLEKSCLSVSDTGIKPHCSIKDMQVEVEIQQQKNCMEKTETNILQDFHSQPKSENSDDMRSTRDKGHCTFEIVHKDDCIPSIFQSDLQQKCEHSKDLCSTSEKCQYPSSETVPQDDLSSPKFLSESQKEFEQHEESGEEGHSPSEKESQDKPCTSNHKCSHSSSEKVSQVDFFSCDSKLESTDFIPSEALNNTKQEYHHHEEMCNITSDKVCSPSEIGSPTVFMPSKEASQEYESCDEMCTISDKGHCPSERVPDADFIHSKEASDSPKQEYEHCKEQCTVSEEADCPSSEMVPDADFINSKEASDSPKQEYEHHKEQCTVSDEGNCPSPEIVPDADFIHSKEASDSPKQEYEHHKEQCTVSDEGNCLSPEIVPDADFIHSKAATGSPKQEYEHHNEVCTISDEEHRPSSKIVSDADFIHSKEASDSQLECEHQYTDTTQDCIPAETLMTTSSKKRKNMDGSIEDESPCQVPRLGSPCGNISSVNEYSQSSVSQVDFISAKVLSDSQQEYGVTKDDSAYHFIPDDTRCTTSAIKRRSDDESIEDKSPCKVPRLGSPHGEDLLPDLNSPSDQQVPGDIVMDMEGQSLYNDTPGITIHLIPLSAVLQMYFLSSF